MTETTTPCGQDLATSPIDDAMVDAFDMAWPVVGERFSCDQHAVLRSRLARAILDLARSGAVEPMRIAVAAASSVMGWPRALSAFLLMQTKQKDRTPWQI